MQDQNKISLSYNLLVLSAALWLFAGVFAIFSQVFTFLVNLLHLNNFFKSISEIVSVALLAVIVFGVFTGCIMLSDWAISKFWPKLHSLNQRKATIITSSIFTASVVGIYFLLAWLLVILENQI